MDEQYCMHMTGTQSRNLVANVNRSLVVINCTDFLRIDKQRSYPTYYCVMYSIDVQGLPVSFSKGDQQREIMHTLYSQAGMIEFLNMLQQVYVEAGQIIEREGHGEMNSTFTGLGFVQLNLESDTLVFTLDVPRTWVYYVYIRYEVGPLHLHSIMVVVSDILSLDECTLRFILC